MRADAFAREAPRGARTCTLTHLVDASPTKCRLVSRRRRCVFPIAKCPGPKTPASSRFLLSRRQPGRQREAASTPPLQASGTQTPQFHATPRFATQQPQQPQPQSQPYPFSTPSLPLVARSSRSHVVGETIDDDSSPLSSPHRAPADDHNGDDDVAETDAASPSTSPSPSDAEERLPKRRKTSLSDLGIGMSSSPAQDAVSANSDDDDYGEPEAHAADDSGSSPDHDRLDDAHEGNSAHAPTFWKPPRFKAADDAAAAAQPGQLPAPFSPQRRGLRYLAGGLAAEVRDWLVQIKRADDAPADGGFAATLAVGEVRAAPGLALVSGPDSSQDGRVGRAILAGDGRLRGLAKNRVVEGRVVGIAQPAWDVELQHGGGVWTVACDWAVLPDGDGV